MPANPTVRIDHLAGPISVLQDRGATVGRLLRRADLPLGGIDDPNLRVPARSTYRFLALAARAEGMPELGIASARGFQPFELRWSRVALTAGTRLIDALSILARTSRRESDQMRLWFEPAEQGAWFCYRGSLPIDADGATLTEQFMLRLLAEFVRAGLDQPWRPSAARLQSRSPTSLRNSDCFADCELQVGAADTGLFLPTALLRQRLGNSASRAGSIDQEVRLVHDLRRHLLDSIGEPESWPGVEAAASVQGSSVRTLQRKLEQAGSSYFELVDRLRRDLAADLIKDPARPLTEIAIDLGYSDAAHFSRAFRRWFGAPPSHYRRQA